MSELAKLVEEIHAGIPEEAWDNVPDANGWLPIKTAPKDGTPILGYDGRGQRVIKWDAGGLFTGWFIPCLTDQYPGGSFMRDPTHWQPLPKSPVKRIGAAMEVEDNEALEARLSREMPMYMEARRIYHRMIYAGDDGTWADETNPVRVIIYATAILAEELQRLTERIAELEAALNAVVHAWDAEHFMRTGDMHSADCGCLRCVIDEAKAIAKTG